MLEDIRTVIWKERKSMFRYQGSKSRFLLLLLSPVVLATVFPITYGPDWLNELPPLVLAFIVPTILVGVMVPDSFAGERERQTLGTLLASRLSDRAILFGKLLVPMAVGWGATLAFVVWSMVLVNLVHGQGEFLFFSAPIAWGSLALSFLMASLTAGAGVLVSLRAQTAQQAAQALMAMILVPAMLVQVVPLLFRDQVGQFIESVDGPQLLALVVAVLAVLDVVVLLAAVARFQRSRLISV
jgi:ABC-2 type transport system permease protein